MVRNWWRIIWGCVKYNDIIKTYSEKFELFTRVLYDYNKFESKNRNREKIFEFINKSWSNYKNELSLLNNGEDLEKALIQVIIYSVLNGRRTINKIKERVNLWNLYHCILKKVFMLEK